MTLSGQRLRHVFSDPELNRTGLRVINPSWIQCSLLMDSNLGGGVMRIS